MNLAEMVRNVNSECHPITNIDGIIKRHLNRGQKVVASKGPKGGWLWLRQYGFTLTTVADQEEYSLSPLVDVAKVITFRDAATPGYIQSVSDQEFSMFDPGPTSTGSAYLYRLKGFSPVQNQPSAASLLSLVSSSAADTAVVVNIQGLDASGVLINETVTLNGAVAVSSVNSYTRILALSKATNSVGKVTITSNAGIVTNVVISSKDRHTTHPVVAITNIPDSADTLYYDFTMKLPNITADDDVSLIPEQYHDSVELYAKAQIFKHLNNPTMAQIVLAEFESRINDMRQDFVQPSGVFTLNDFEPDCDFSGPYLPSNYPRGS